MSDDRSTLTIPADFVPTRYHYDPNTEVLIPSGRLKAGMIVVLYDSLNRGDPEQLSDLSGAGQLRLLANARWSRIESLGRDPDHVIINCVYADGSLHSRNAYDHFKWIVKKASAA